MGDIEDRIERERVSYNKGLKRSFFYKMDSYSSAYCKINEKIKSEMYAGDQKNILEIGTSEWYNWVEKNGISPTRIVSINISEKALDSAIKKSKRTILNPDFKKMDAHSLKFKDESFDVVFGSSILHHLDLEPALLEIKRVLKVGGKIVFYEPLDINPVSRIVRLLTPQSRTIDEVPFRSKHLNIVRKVFDCEIYYYQLFSVPFGIIASFFFGKPKNFLTYIGSSIDRLAFNIFPFLKSMARGS